MSSILILALDLIRIPSVSFDLTACRHVLDYINAYLDHKGQIIEYNDKPSLIVANYDTTIHGKRADVVLNGHIDVVPPTQEGQFDPKIVGDKLYARGAGDMKAGVAILVELMKKILTDGFFGKKVLLMITSDEEVGGFDGVGKLVEDGRGGDLVLIPDSGDLYRFVIAEKGILTINVQANGFACHSSRPRLGDNAITKAYRFFEALKNDIVDMEKLVAPDYRGSTCEVTMVSGGKAMNTIPDSCAMTINIRHTEDWSRDTLIQTVKNHADRIGVSVDVSLYGPLLYTNPTHSLIQNYHTLARNHLGEQVVQGQEHGASDGRFFAERGSVVILHRPTCANIHGNDECVQISDMEKLFFLYDEVVRS
ncbi:MAG: M20/M25/M40 family metallo-hydrolase [Candidatus Absconditabacterales bacterium]|nr:M20/M25/M40 family metallo-hydrolase [Candidatus Absconditabacterales bacterium]